MVPIEPKDGTRAGVDWWVSVKGLTPTPPSEPLKPSTGAAVRDHRNAVRDRSESLSAIDRNHCPHSPESAVEILGGLAVLLGALVPLASIPMAIVLLTAMFTVPLPYGFSSIKLQAITAAGAQFGPPGYETDLLYLACLAALVLGGSGPLSIDRLLADRTSEAAATPNSTI
jgi:hypothetical protein